MVESWSGVKAMIYYRKTKIQQKHRKAIQFVSIGSGTPDSFAPFGCASTASFSVALARPLPSCSASWSARSSAASLSTCRLYSSTAAAATRASCSRRFFRCCSFRSFLMTFGVFRAGGGVGVRAAGEKAMDGVGTRGALNDGYTQSCPQRRGGRWGPKTGSSKSARICG
jgi:hypothetical protein